MLDDNDIGELNDSLVRSSSLYPKSFFTDPLTFQTPSNGLRDRDIATQRIVSESTVKFHINHILAKFQVKTRFQALDRAMIKGLI